jgi:hypothetical protein
MFTTRLHQPAPRYCDLDRKGTSRKAAWQRCAVSNVAGSDLSFGRTPALEISSSLFSLLDRTAMAQQNPEAHP